MFGIELTTGTKIQITLVVLILGAAGLMLLRNSHKPLNDAVNSWVVVQKQFKAGTNNKEYDPSLEATVNTFTCADGKMEITEFKNNPAKGLLIRWLIDPKRTDFLYYRDPLAHVTQIKDPYKHAIALAAYTQAKGTSLHFLDNAGLAPEQIKAITEAGRVMGEELEVIRGAVENGTYKMNLLEKVKQVLADYKRVKGNPLNDKPKADAARLVIVTANDYLNKADDERSASIEKYISKINSVLSSDQKQKVADAGKAYDTARTVARNPGNNTTRRTAPATPTTARAPNGRGGAATTPAGQPARTRPVAPNTPVRPVTPTTPRPMPATPQRVAPPSPTLTPAGG